MPHESAGPGQLSSKPYKQGGTGIEKKRPGVDFFFFWTLGGLTNYVIRHMSKYSNITSSARAPL